ncbi:MAG: hypothetical protein LUG23_09845, partial [Oscillospiraceae bacterium]|nr:hypothetical protein [Oscillospiraceae bacterium]
MKKQWIYFEAVIVPEDEEWPELPNISTEEEVIQSTQVFAAITIEDLRWYEDGMFIDWRGASSSTTTPDTETPPESLPEIENSEENGVRLLVIMPATEGGEDSEEVEGFEAEELEEREEGELEEEEDTESSGVYRGLVIGKSETAGEDDSNDCVENLEMEGVCYNGGDWYALCNGYICGDTISSTIQMGTCPWLCLDSSYVCCSGSCGSCN